MPLTFMPDRKLYAAAAGITLDTRRTVVPAQTEV